MTRTFPSLWEAAHAFVWNKGVMTDLGRKSTSHLNHSGAVAINNKGQIAGTSWTGDKAPLQGGAAPSHAVLWTLRNG